MDTPAHREQVQANRDAGAKPAPPSRKVLASDPEPEPPKARVVKLHDEKKEK